MSYVYLVVADTYLAVPDVYLMVPDVYLGEVSMEGGVALPGPTAGGGAAPLLPASTCNGAPVHSSSDIRHTGSLAHWQSGILAARRT
jgi:hypothetical protein